MQQCFGKYFTNQCNAAYFLICCWITIIIKQIGNRFALTAAHCLYDEDEDKKEVLPASSFSIMLGLHDRRKTTDPKR